MPSVDGEGELDGLAPAIHFPRAEHEDGSEPTHLLRDQAGAGVKQGETLPARTGDQRLTVPLTVQKDGLPFEFDRPLNVDQHVLPVGVGDETGEGVVGRDGAPRTGRDGLEGKGMGLCPGVSDPERLRGKGGELEGEDVDDILEDSGRPSVGLEADVAALAIAACREGLGNACAVEGGSDTSVVVRAETPCRVEGGSAKGAHDGEGAVLFDLLNLEADRNREGVGRGCRREVGEGLDVLPHAEREAGGVPGLHVVAEGQRGLARRVDPRGAFRHALGMRERTGGEHEQSSEQGKAGTKHRSSEKRWRGVSTGAARWARRTECERGRARRTGVARACTIRLLTGDSMFSSHVESRLMRTGSAALLPALLLMGLAWPSHAGTLPLVVDRSGSEAPRAWWVDGAQGDLDGHLFAVLGREGGCAATARGGRDGLSRVLRRPDLTATNARAVGSVFGCARVLTGQLEVVDSGLSAPWLGLHRVVLGFSARLVDVERGSVLHQFERRAVGVAVTPAEARARAVAHMERELGRVLSGLEVRAARLEALDDDPAVVFLSGGTADGYVALAGMLSDGLGGVRSVEERWASEGRLSVRVQFSESGSLETLTAALTRLEGATVEGAVVERVQRTGASVFVLVGSADGAGR